MDLTVVERLQLLSILPKEGDILSLRVVRELRGALSFSEEEIARFNLKIEGGQAFWDTAAATPKEVVIGPKALALIVDSLEALNTSKKLNVDYVPLYEKFVESK